MRHSAWAAVALMMLLLAGCNAQKQPAYEDKQGFRFVPPPGWVERARDDAMPARVGHRQQNLPLPPLGVSGHRSEHFLVRYDRISTADHAWLRVTVADLPSSTSLKACLSICVPERGWKRESEEDGLEVSGLPAARIAFVGRYYDRDYLCETFAVRKGEKAYLFSTAFPASDDTAREHVRQAVLQARWQ
jgi:hypothetical protein